MAAHGERKPDDGRGRGRWLRPLAVLAAIALAAVLVHGSGAFAGSLREQVLRFDAFFESLGGWAPAAFVGIWILVSVLMLPGLPVSIVGGLVFGAVWGTVWTTVGANLGAAAAFLIGRYAARETVAGWISGSRTLERLDRGVDRHGWRMLMVTRLVPVFPFNLQNYAYGLTRIRFATYVLVTLPCMLPGTVAYTFAAGSAREAILAGGQPEGMTRFLVLIGVAAVGFVLLSLLPRWVRRRVDAPVPEDRDGSGREDVTRG